jgi:porphobilinogen deaminase
MPAAIASSTSRCRRSTAKFFTAEIDAALLAGDVDFTVHSFRI